MTSPTQPEFPWPVPQMPVDETPPSWLDRNFTRLLLAIAAAGLVPRLILGNSMPIGFDGWWHLFCATQDRWQMMWGEWKLIAHPPLFYPLLRFAAACGHSPLVLRSIGIAAGCAGTVVFGIIAAKIYRLKASALLAAAAYTFSWSMIEMNCDLRAYPLALLFVLLAFNALIDWSADPAGSRAGRAIVRFGAYLSLAILCEYYVVFFFAGCLGILVLPALLRPAFRAVFLRSLHVHWKQWLCSIVSTTFLFLVFFSFHMNIKPTGVPYLENFVWKENSLVGLDWFLLSNLGKEIAFFAPFNLDSGLILALILLFFLPALIYFAAMRKDLWRGAFAAAPPALLAALLAQLVVLSIANKYPFGGEFRHQSIIAPFVFLTSFLLLDLVGGLLKASLARNGLFIAAGLLVASSFAFGWSVYPWTAVELKAADYVTFRELFPSPVNIYTDPSSTIFYFGKSNQSKWTYQYGFRINQQWIEAYQVDDGKGHAIRLLRNMSKAWFDLTEPETYRVLAGALQQERQNSAVLFFVGLDGDDAGVKLWEEKIRELTPQAGLELGRYAVGRTHVFIEFKLRETLQ